jgi:RHS repeat-associated protein
MIFKYAYDSRGRMTSKTVPSGGTTTIAYDRLDRPVLTTDAKGFKVFTRYDILSRPVVTGKYKGTASPAGTNPLFETPNTTAPHYYTSTSFPTDNNLDVYKVFYYDDYDIDNNGSLSGTETYTNPAESGYETAAFLRTRGKPTASKTGILKNDGTAPTVFLTTRTYYDKEYSVIQVNKQNHLSGADITSSAYDFANRVTKTRRDHTGTPPGGSQKTYYIREEYTYDEAGRLRFTRHNVKTTAGVPTGSWVVTAAPVYDELNRLADKRLHASNYDGINPVALGASFNYLQSLDYAYNIRGWLTSINNPGSCALQGGDQLADLFNMSLDYESTANGATAQFNGNIAAMQWRTNVNGSCLTRQQYRFTYDYANRLLTANHFTHNGAGWVNTNNYSESNISYDLNGNIKSYTRRGLTAPATFGVIDQLTYTYGDAARPDRLTNVSDAGSAAKGFKFTSGAAAYTYDLNGNLTQDNHKSLSFQYNYLNLPNYITNPGGSEITITYTADGEKLTKTTPTETRNYVSGIEYLGNALDAIYHGEGRCTPNGASAFYYEYTIKDHLGNARINFRANGTAVTFLQELHYYPFGMLMEGIGTAPVTNNGYKYNGKELNEDLGLNLSDYGARWYDASLGRWWSVDPMGYVLPTESPYNYAGCNPVSNIDLYGMLKYPSGANYGKYKKLTSFLKGENGNFNKFLSNPDIRDGLKIMGGWTDEEINNQILKWDGSKSLELELTYTPGGDAMINGNTTYSNIQLNQALVDKLESATSIEEERGILLAIMTTILHECIHWGDNQNLDVKQQTEGNFSKNGRMFRYKGVIIADKDNDETGNAFENAVWGGGNNVSPKIDDASIQAYIQRWQILYANEKPEEKSKAPEPVPRA